MANKNPKPTDQRSNVKNPNNTGFKPNQDNKANQLNPNHQPTKTTPPPAIKK